MSIGQLAREAGIHLETIRFYEREGLIPAPSRFPPGTGPSIKRRSGDCDLSNEHKNWGFPYPKFVIYLLFTTHRTEIAPMFAKEHSRSSKP